MFSSVEISIFSSLKKSSSKTLSVRKRSIFGGDGGGVGGGVGGNGWGVGGGVGLVVVVVVVVVEILESSFTKFSGI